ncbi:MAG: rhodanese-like domain-containing protein [Clostridiales bacterium]|nr:rhodanese-like domain-containing protein [Clostridiales bacterium]
MYRMEMISAKMLDEYVDRPGARILDLRDPEEYRISHVRGAENLPYRELEEIRGLSRENLLIFYCDRGGASIKAAKLLAEKGYDTRAVVGGFQAYRGRNLVISGEA